MSRSSTNQIGANYATLFNSGNGTTYNPPSPFGPMGPLVSQMAGGFLGQSGLPVGMFASTGGAWVDLFDAMSVQAMVTNARSTSYILADGDADRISNVIMGISKPRGVSMEEYKKTDAGMAMHERALTVSNALSDPTNPLFPMAQMGLQMMGIDPEILTPNIRLPMQSMQGLSRSGMTPNLASVQKLAELVAQDTKFNADKYDANNMYGFSPGQYMGLGLSLQARGVLAPDMTQAGVDPKAQAAAYNEALKETVKPLLPSMAVIKSLLGTQSEEDTVRGLQAVTGGGLGQMTSEQVKDQVGKFHELVRTAGIASEALVTFIEETVNIARQSGMNTSVAARSALESFNESNAVSNAANMFGKGREFYGAYADPMEMARGRSRRTLAAQASPLAGQVAAAAELLLGERTQEELKAELEKSDDPMAKDILAVLNGETPEDITIVGNENKLATFVATQTGKSFEDTKAFITTRDYQQYALNKFEGVTSAVVASQLQEVLGNAGSDIESLKSLSAKDRTSVLSAAVLAGADKEIFTDMLANLKIDGDFDKDFSAIQTAGNRSLDGLRRNDVNTDEMLKAQVYAEQGELSKKQLNDKSSGTMDLLEALGGESAFNGVQAALTAAGDGDIAKAIGAFMGNQGRGPLLERVLDTDNKAGKRFIADTIAAIEADPKSANSVDRINKMDKMFKLPEGELAKIVAENPNDSATAVNKRLTELAKEIVASEASDSVKSAIKIETAVETLTSTIKSLASNATKETTPAMTKQEYTEATTKGVKEGLMGSTIKVVGDHATIIPDVVDAPSSSSNSGGN